MKRNLFIAIFTLLSAALAKDSAVTPSVLIVATPEEIKHVLVSEMTSRKYKIDSDSKLQIVFWKEENSAPAPVSTGGSACALPKHLLTIALAPGQGRGAFRVTAVEEIEFQLEKCAPTRIPLNSKKQVDNLQHFLESVKSQSENWTNTVR